ncbi:hypothetical protein [Roseibacillus persicicus]|uniref:hypothetical protein n=1 Tax=Roseibacillus persicicus TaxID=454148 RepID=UPI00280C43DE|nr:hypothetical protein [Roseibacillus persicicus]MDQ8190635.1 hypothetical protein [Roseibacillus persicicus]
MRKTNYFILTTGLLTLTSPAAELIKGDATAGLGPDFFIDDAATGGSDVTVNEPDSLGAGRQFSALEVGPGGSLLEITGFAFATSSSSGANDATELTINFSYLGDDGVFNTADDVVLGGETVTYTHSGAGEYYVVFDTPITALVTGGAPWFRVEVVPTNSEGAGSVRFKSGALAAETFQGPKLTVAGTSTAFDPSAGGDLDGDGLADSVETNTGIFVSLADTGTDPNDNDSDGDGLLDGDEILGDSVNGFTSDPNIEDTDSDGVDDGDEVNGTLNTVYYDEATDPDDADTDDDTISDGDELLTTGTDPNFADSDGDGLTDPEEDVNLDGIVDSNETSATDDDTDGDGLLDGWEVRHGLDAINTDDSQGDPDGDLLLNIDEFNRGENSTDPNDSDSDNDKLSDRFEFDSTGLFDLLDPNSRDTDNDGLGDKFEVDNGLDPFVNDDFDEDLISDAQEVLFYGTDPKNGAEFPGDGSNPGLLELTPIKNFGSVFFGSNLPIRPSPEDSDALATAIINEAVQGGADLSFGNGMPDFTVVYPDLFPAAGTEVTITGLAWVVPGAGTANGDIAFEFYDPEAADSDPDFDGVDCETLVGRATGTLQVSGTTGISYLEFAEPVNFVSSGTSLGVRMMSTGALRLKAQSGFASGLRYSNSGEGLLEANNTMRLTLFGTPANIVEPDEVIITDCGFDENGDFYIEVEGGVAGKVVTGTNDLSGEFELVTTSNDGANRFTIAAANLDFAGLGYEFFRVESN